jgi:DNA ligase 1
VRQDRIMLLARLAATSTAVRDTSARSAKIALIAACLADAEPSEIEATVAYLSGDLRQRRTGLGYASLRDRPPPAAEPSVQVGEVDAAFEHIAGLAGPGSQNERRRLLAQLFGRLTEEEQGFVIGLVSGELRQGALEGVMVEAIARAANVPVADVRRAVMLRGAMGPVAAVALTEGGHGLDHFRLAVGRALQPMLAQTADSIDAAVERIRPAAVEWKLDGIRVQVHRDGSDVAVFTRTLDDISARVPEVVEAALSLPVRSIVLDGEAIALADDDRPRSFQVTASRIGTRTDVASQRRATPLTVLFFDVLHVDGQDVLALSGTERAEALSAVVPEALRVPRIVTDSVDDARAFLDDALARGHEGVVVKALDVPYEAGRRGSGWIKVKPRHTLDLVVLAAEWGHGRRRGWLSNLHLGARDADNGGYVMLGKTFKGLTDAMLTWQTEELLRLEASRNDWQVFVRPELVVEVAFDGVQTSPRYPGGMALRFARVLRYRPDKRGEDADTVETVRAIHRGPPSRS